MKSLISNKIRATLGVFVLTLTCILWEYFNGGVVTHNLLAREDMPGFSNWWGLLTVPLLFWIGISLIHRRQANGDTTKANETQVLTRFLTALAFGILMSLLWEFKIGGILDYIILFPILMAFFKPIHLPEYLMGFVLGMVFTFGGVLPLIFGMILLLICFLIHSIIRILRTFILSKTNRTK